MRLQKLICGIFAFFVLFAPFAEAVDIAPIVTISSDYSRTTTTAVITAAAVDALDNSGLAWIKLYENGNLIAEKNCGQASSCILIKPVSKSFPGGTFTYRADAYDRGNHLSSSEQLTIVFAGVDEVSPEYDDIRVSPASPAEYGVHTFTVEWTDNGRIGQVFIEHDFFGELFRAEVTSHEGNDYTYVLNGYESDAEIGTHQWRMQAYDVAEQGPNTASTPWQSYTIVKADVDFEWDITPSASFDYGAESTIACAVENEMNIESEAVLYRNNEEVSNPNTAVLIPGTYNYTCSAESTKHFNEASEERTITVNKLPSDITLMLGGRSENTTIERLHQDITLRGDIVVGDGVLQLFVAGENVDESESPLVYLQEAFEEIGSYEVRLVMAETDIYSAVSESFYINVVDTNAPREPENLEVSNITLNSAVLSWENPADRDNDFAGTMIFIDGENVANSTGTSYLLSGLDYNTEYEVEIFSYDTYGNVNSNGDRRVFMTLPDTDAPEWSNEGLELENWVYGTEAGETYSVVTVPSTATKLASEVVDISEQNIISVGNPCNNPITNVIMGRDINDQEGCESLIPAGKAIIKVYEHGDYSQIVVAGSSDLLTRMAARVLTESEDYNLAGKYIEVTGTSLTDIDVVSTEADTGDSNDLSRYPKFLFGEDSEGYYYDGYLVVGDSAPVSDVVALVDIAQSLNHITFKDNRNPSIAWSDNTDSIASVWFEHDFSGSMATEPADGNSSNVYFINMTDLPAGTYNWRGHARDASGNTASTEWFDFTIYKAEPVLSLELNGSPEDITVWEQSDLNITARLIEGEGNITLSAIAGGTSALIYEGPAPYSEVNGIGNSSFDVELSYAETQNYTSGSVSYTVDVIQVVRSFTISAVPASAIAAEGQDAEFEIVVENTGNRRESITLSVSSAGGADSAVLNSTTIEVDAEDSESVTLTASDSAVGQYNITITARYTADSGYSRNATATLNVVDYSNVIRSTINSVYYASGSYTNAQIPQLLAATVVDSTVDNASYIEASEVQRSTIASSTVDASSEINDSIVRNSDLTSCIVLNSTLEGITASNCRIEDSNADPSDLTGSTITGDSSIVDSNVTYSTVDDSDISNSDINNSIITGSVISGSIVYDSTITDSVVDSADIRNSTVINSTIPEGADIDDAYIEDGVIVNGTVDGTDYTGTPTNLTDAVNYAPVASFTSSATSITAGGSVMFTSTSTDANIPGALNDSLTYNWTIAGTSVSTASGMSYTFASAGTYTVQLEATDRFGKSDTESVVISVASPSSGGSSGGGRRTSSDPRTIPLDFAKGSIITLDVYQGDVIMFTFEGAKHKLTVKDVTLDYVDVVVESTPISARIAKYKSANFNINGDMLYDFGIMVAKIIGNSGATFVIDVKELIYEDEPVAPQPSESSEEDEEEQPADSDASEDSVFDTEIDSEADESEEQPGIWQRFIAWLKSVFIGSGESDADAENATALTGAASTDAESDAEFEDEQEAEDSEEESDAVSENAEASDAESEQSDESEAEASQPWTVPKALIGSLLIVLIIGLGLGFYFIARKKVMEKRIEQYLM